ncbi:MAG: anti-sigma factor [Burkholderiales bacterium]|nr:MAG: anti-sigma factor [Burkholderiales bacterium]
MSAQTPITEADLNAYVDEELPAGRRDEVEVYLDARPSERERLKAYLHQKRAMRERFDDVLREPLPPRLTRVKKPGLPWYMQRLAAGVVIAITGAASGWGLRGQTSESALADATPAYRAVTRTGASDLPHRAAVAYAVYSADTRRPVEIGAQDQDQLVAWLSKRLNAPMHPPRLQSIGYSLEGGRLLPGDRGPVAQFMYRNEASGGRMTVYVSPEASQQQGPKQTDTAFKFAKEGAVNVFYWVDGPFGYAISAESDRDELIRASNEIYRQLSPRAAG